MKLLIGLPLIFLSCFVFAEPADTCWGEPVGSASITLGKLPFTSNKQGKTATVSFSAKPGSFTGFCHFSEETRLIGNTTLLGSGLTRSGINPGYLKLTDDVDVRIEIRQIGIPFNFGSGGATSVVDILDNFVPLPAGEHVPAKGFSVSTYGEMTFKLRRDVIGGAVIIPGDIELYSVYASVRRPDRASKPVYRVKTQSSSQIIAIPPECSINQGKAIEVNFDNVKTTSIPDDIAKSETGYVRDVALNFSCNSSLTQDIQVRLVADASNFSSALIRSNKPRLGFVMKHNGQVVKPWGSFRSRLEGGKSNETITLAPVKAPELTLQGGPFSASATLIIMSL